MNGSTVHVPYFGRGTIETEVPDKALYRIRHECLPMVIYRGESQFTVLQAPGFHSATVDGVTTHDYAEALELMQAHMAKKHAAPEPQITAANVQRSLLARSMPRLTIHTLAHYPDLTPMVGRMAVWRTLHSLNTIPALCAPRQCEIVPFPMTEMVVSEQEEQAA